MILPKRELECFLVALVLPRHLHMSAEAIKQRIWRDYGVDISRKRVQDILKSVSAYEILDSQTKWHHSWQRKTYRSLVREGAKPEREI